MLIWAFWRSYYLCHNPGGALLLKSLSLNLLVSLWYNSHAVAQSLTPLTQHIIGIQPEKLLVYVAMKTAGRRALLPGMTTARAAFENCHLATSINSNNKFMYNYCYVA